MKVHTGQERALTSHPTDSVARWACTASPACVADLDQSEVVDVFDLLVYLDRWFASDAAAEFTGDDPASIDVFDLLAYLDLWFAGCN
jgi:hypothetical protein